MEEFFVKEIKMSMDKQLKEFKEELELRSSEELIQIWVGNNRARWPYEAFVAIKLILDERGEDLPSQSSPTYKSTLYPTPAPRVKKLKKQTSLRRWLHSLLPKCLNIKCKNVKDN
jgi:hypothetical protein